MYYSIFFLVYLPFFCFLVSYFLYCHNYHRTSYFRLSPSRLLFLLTEKLSLIIFSVVCLHFFSFLVSYLLYWHDYTFIEHPTFKSFLLVFYFYDEAFTYYLYSLLIFVSFVWLFSLPLHLLCSLSTLLLPPSLLSTVLTWLSFCIVSFSSFISS